MSRTWYKSVAERLLKGNTTRNDDARLKFGRQCCRFFYLVLKNLQLLTGNEMLGLTSLCTPSYTISICLVGVKNHLKDGSFDLFFWKIHCLETKVKCFREGAYASYVSYRRILFMKSFCEARLIYSRKTMKFDYYFLDFSSYLIKTIKRTGHVRKRTPV